jgi:phosphoglycolate phosphatase
VVERALERLVPDPSAREAMARAGGYDPATRRFVPGSPIVAGPTRAIALAWAPWRPDLGADGLEDALDAIAVEAIAEPDLPTPAARDLPALLDRLIEDGHVLGVATNDSLESAERQLAAVGARDRFAFVAGYDSVARPKPAPDVVHAFAAVTGLAPGRVAVIGDSAHDLETARAAGCGLALAVLTGPAEAGALALLADAVLESIEDLPAFLARRRGRDIA